VNASVRRVVVAIAIVAVWIGYAVPAHAAPTPSRGVMLAADYNWYQTYYSLKECGLYCWEWHTKLATEVEHNSGYNQVYAKWIDCSDTGGVGFTVTVTWCGRANDSTSSFLDVGENYTVSWLFHGSPVSVGCWFRIHIYPYGNAGYFPSSCAWQYMEGQ
jgi:hypothetical protein